MAPFLSKDTDSSNKFTHGSPEDKSIPIAIVGMSFRGPGSASSVENLWKMICEKREARTAIPKSRWNNDAFYHPDFERHGTHNVEYGHFFEEDISKFDAPFFNMTSTEAAALDPAQRLLLECTYEALENGKIRAIKFLETYLTLPIGGIPLEKVVGTKTSVFVGSFATDYTDLLTRDPETVPMYQCTNSGQSRAMVANRLSYFFDLHGPSVTVDTACSGSLVALHLACQSLRTGEAKSAIAAGVNVVLNHEFMITMSMMK
jgi:acyl transferase domain-containing protein